MRIAAMLVRSSTRTLTCAPAIHNRRLHARRNGRPRAVLHQHRPAGLRPDQPAGNRQGRAVRALLAIGEIAAPSVPRRVRWRRFGARRSGRRLGRLGPRRQAVRARAERIRRRLGRAARQRARRVRGRVERPDEGARVGAPHGVPRAIDAVRAVHRPAQRPMEIPRAGRARRIAAAGAVRADARPCVRHVRAMDPRARIALPREASEVAGRLRRRLPIRHPREGARHAARPAPGRHHLQPRACSAPVRRSRRCCNGCSRTRWPRSARHADAAARGTAPGHPGVHGPSRSAQPRRPLDSVSRRHAQALRHRRPRAARRSSRPSRATR